MKYYKISQYSKMSNIIEIPHISEDEIKSARGIVRWVNDPTSRKFLNFYTKPYPIISDKLKDIFEPYLPDIIGIPLKITNADFSDTEYTYNMSDMFWFLSLETIECKWESPKADKDSNTGIILEVSNIEGRKLFTTKAGHRNHVIADLDIVELILRNSIVDFEYTLVTII